MREDSKGYGVLNEMHWHDGTTCHGAPTAEACIARAISSGWIGKVLEVEDVYRDGTKAKCYSLIAGRYDHYAKHGKFVFEVKLIALPIVE